MPASHCEGFSCCGAWALGTGVSVVAVGGLSMDHGLSCSAVCGIFLDRGLNWCLLHYKVDSQPVDHQESPDSSSFLFFFLGVQFSDF